MILKKIYSVKNNSLPYHGWHHIIFVTKKAIDIAKSIKANCFIVQSAAMVHDPNYVQKQKLGSDIANNFRKFCLRKAGYNDKEMEIIEGIVSSAHIANRGYLGSNISKEAKALSDADTLFKSLHLTPILLAKEYMNESGLGLIDLAKKIIHEKASLLKNNQHFLTEYAKIRYTKWAKTNIDLWSNLIDSLSDNDIGMLIEEIDVINSSSS